MTSENPTLDALAAAIKSVDDATYYGIASKLPKGSPWNYTVFSRQKDATGSDRLRITEYYEVAVVRENFIPEGVVDAVAAAIRALPGFKDSGDDTEYVYDVKPGTSDVVEMAVMHFTHGRLRS